MPLCRVCYPDLTTSSGTITWPVQTTTTTTSSATTWTISNCSVCPTTYPIRTATITWVDPYQGMWLNETAEQRVAQCRTYTEEQNDAIRRAQRWEAEIEGQIDDLQRDLSRPHIRDSVRQEQLQRRDAEEKARELLLANLTERQRETLRANKWFVIEGRSGQLYRVRDTGHLVANIDVVERDLIGHERVLHRLCGHIGDMNVPIADHLLAQKLMLEADEDAFLRLANRHA